MPPSGLMEPERLRYSILSLAFIKQTRVRFCFLARKLRGNRSLIECVWVSPAVFQKTNILRGLSVFDNVYVAALRATESSLFPLYDRIRGQKEARTLADEVLTRVGLSEQRHREAQTIPYGDQRMLDVAMALACKPRVLLLDEMTSGLSAGEIETATEIIRDLSKSHTILLIEHNMNVVLNIAETITVIDFGEVIAEGSPEAIKTNSRVQDAYFGGVL